MTLSFISLFSGFGGLDLGMEMAGLQCVAQVENNIYAQKILSKHWPHVLRLGDVREAGAHNLPAADVIAGGFPCVDISEAGRGAGITGPQSGLWKEFARVIGEVRPKYVLVENVSALLVRGIGTVLGDLSSLLYHARGGIVPACAFGASHTRERLFIVAYSQDYGRNLFSNESRVISEVVHPWNKFSSRRSSLSRRVWPFPPSEYARMADGLSPRMERDRAERLRGLGNAVAIPVAKFMGEYILRLEEKRSLAEMEECDNGEKTTRLYRT